LLLVALVSWLAFGHQTVTSSTGEIAGNAQGSNNATTYEASTTNKEVAEGSRVAAAVVTPTTAVRGSASGGRASKDGVGFVAASTGSTRREAKGSRSSLRPRVSEASETLPISFSVDGGSVIAPPLPPSQTGETASTDFVPLGPAGVSAPLDSGQMVRVEVPRAALAALGLPVNVARANETVKADVLLAHDGTARAIRLVQ
jgi:hypothetical protein